MILKAMSSDIHSLFYLKRGHTDDFYNQWYNVASTI